MANSADVNAGDDILASQYNNLRAERCLPGSIVMYGGDSAPTGWLLCQGQAVSRTTYSSLYAIIGTTFGVGDDSTTFNLPDLQDKFPIGKSGTKALGSTGGANTKDLTHNHGGSTGTPNAGTNYPTNGVDVKWCTGPDHTHSISSGGSATQDVLNAYQALNYIIKT